MGVVPFVRVQILSCGKRALGLAQEGRSPQLIVICDINHQCKSIPAALVLKILSRGICQLCLLSQLLQVALSNCLLMKSLTHGTRVGPSHQHVVRLHSQMTESEPNSWYLWMPLIIQEYTLKLCQNHFADGGDHVAGNWEGFSCCLVLLCPAGTHHRICKKRTNSSTLKDSFAFVFFFLLIFQSVASQENYSVISATCLQSTGTIALWC